MSPLVLQKLESLTVDDYPWEHCNVPGFVYMVDILEQLLRQVSPTILEKRPCEVLDIGCGPGYVLDILRARGWNTTGLDPWGGLAEWCRKYFRLDVQANRIETANLPRDHYDLVFMSEVIEQLPDPVETLKLVREHLVPKTGVLFLSCPNFDSMTFKEQGWDWSPINPFGHIQYFTPVSLGSALKKAGFSSVVVRKDGGLPHQDEQLMVVAVRES